MPDPIGQANGNHLDLSRWVNRVPGSSKITINADKLREIRGFLDDLENHLKRCPVDSEASNIIDAINVIRHWLNPS